MSSAGAGLSGAFDVKRWSRAARAATQVCFVGVIPLFFLWTREAPLPLTTISPFLVLFFLGCGLYVLQCAVLLRFMSFRELAGALGIGDPRRTMPYAAHAVIHAIAAALVALCLGLVGDLLLRELPAKPAALPAQVEWAEHHAYSTMPTPREAIPALRKWNC